MRYRDYLPSQSDEQRDEFASTEMQEVSIPLPYNEQEPSASDVIVSGAVPFDVKKGFTTAKHVLQENFPLVYAHIADNANFRFLLQKADGDYERDENFKITEKDIEGYEEFPQLLWAVNADELIEYKRIADDIRYQRAYKETRGFWANFAAGFADPTAWVSGLVGGLFVRGSATAATALARAFNLSLKVRPVAGTILKSAAGGAIAAPVDMVLHDANDNDLARAVQNATVGGILGATFAVAPEIVKAGAEKGKAALFRSQVQSTVDVMVSSSQAEVATRMGTFEQTVGAFTPSVRLANNVNPVVRESASELVAYSFDVYDKKGNIVPQKTPVGVIVDANKNEVLYKLKKGYNKAFKEWADTTPYGWIRKKFRNSNFYLFPKTAREEFDAFLFNAKLNADANGKCHTGIDAVDFYLNETRVPLVDKMTRDAWDAGVYHKQTEAYEKKLLDEVSDRQKTVDDYEENGTKLELKLSKLREKRGALEERYQEFLANTKKAEDFLNDSTEHQLAQLEESAVRKSESIAKEAEKLGESIKQQQGKLSSINRKLSFDYANAAVRGWFRRKDGTVVTAKDVAELRVIDDELGEVLTSLSTLEGKSVRVSSKTTYEQLDDTGKALARSSYLKEQIGFLRKREQGLLEKRDKIVAKLQEVGYEFEEFANTKTPEFTKKTIEKASSLGRRLGFKEGKLAQLESIYRTEMRKIDKKIWEDEEALAKHEQDKEAIEGHRKDIEVLKRKIEKKDYSIKEVFADKDKYYIHRMLDYSAIEKDPEGFQDALMRGFKSLYPQKNVSELKPMAVSIYNDLMLPSSNKRHLSFEQRGAEIERKLNFETKYIADFLVKDEGAELAELANTLIVDTELGKRGMLDVDALQARIQTKGEEIASKLENPKAAALVREDTQKGAEDILRIIDDLRGISYINPFHDKKAAVIARNLNSLTKNALTMQYLGLVHTARMLDMFTTVLHLGLGNYLRGCYRMVNYDLKKISGLTNDELDPFVHAIDENGGRLLHELGKEIANEWAVTRWAREGAAFVTRFARFLDEHGKKTIGYAAEEYILRGCEKAGTGKSLSKNHTNFLLHYGIDEAHAKKIAAEFKAHGSVQSDTGCVFANTDIWSDRSAADTLKAAVRKCQQESIVTPTIGATPLFFKNPMVSLCLQFKRCAFAAAEKATLPFIQKLKRHEYGRCAMAVAVGGFFAYYREEVKDLMTGRKRTREEKIQNALGSLDCFAYGAFLKDVAEKVDIDEQDRFANVYKVLDIAPFTSHAVKTEKAIYAFKKLYTGERLNRSDLSSIKSMVPFYTFFGWARALNALEEKIGKDMMIASYYRDDLNWRYREIMDKPYEISSDIRVKAVRALAAAETKAKNKARDKILNKEKNRDVVYKGAEEIVAKRKEGNRIAGYRVVASEEDLKKTTEKGKRKNSRLGAPVRRKRTEKNKKE